MEPLSLNSESWIVACFNQSKKTTKSKLRSTASLQPIINNPTKKQLLIPNFKILMTRNPYFLNNARPVLKKNPTEFEKYVVQWEITVRNQRPRWEKAVKMRFFCCLTCCLVVEWAFNWRAIAALEAREWAWRLGRRSEMWGGGSLRRKSWIQFSAIFLLMRSEDEWARTVGV